MGNCKSTAYVVEPVLPEAAPPESAPPELKFGVYETGTEVGEAASNWAADYETGVGEAASDSAVDVESDEVHRDDTRRYVTFEEASASADGSLPADEIDEPAVCDG